MGIESAQRDRIVAFQSLALMPKALCTWRLRARREQVQFRWAVSLARGSVWSGAVKRRSSAFQAHPAGLWMSPIVAWYAV
jgi:hypothetical protein